MRLTARRSRRVHTACRPRGAHTKTTQLAPDCCVDIASAAPRRRRAGEARRGRGSRYRDGRTVPQDRGVNVTPPQGRRKAPRAQVVCAPDQRVEVLEVCVRAVGGCRHSQIRVVLLTLRVMLMLMRRLRHSPNALLIHAPPPRHLAPQQSDRFGRAVRRGVPVEQVPHRLVEQRRLAPARTPPCTPPCAAHQCPCARGIAPPARLIPY
ncbi:hypothetical protein C8J57DRAFT_311804 [Mycena rebaudengoi]|nr:hypothetical protein C8J57DRAFT_311804 [Mycena rebaudengoi]